MPTLEELNLKLELKKLELATMRLRFEEKKLALQSAVATAFGISSFYATKRWATEFFYLMSISKSPDSPRVEYWLEKLSTDQKVRNMISQDLRRILLEKKIKVFGSTTVSIVSFSFLYKIFFADVKKAEIP